MYFNLDKYETILKSNLDKQVSKGYQYAIYSGDTLVRSHAAGLASLSPPTPMTSDRRMDVASLSKTITAVGILKAMEDLLPKLKSRAKIDFGPISGPALEEFERSETGTSLSVPTIDWILDWRIAPFLPSNWTLGPGVQTTTFRQVLTHTAGLWYSPDYYNDAAGMIDQGVKGTPGTFSYNNCDYALLRTLLKPLVELRQPTADMLAAETLANGYSTGMFYRDYIRKHVLGPVGLEDVDIVYTGAGPASAYFKASPSSDWRIGHADSTNLLTAGSGCWNISAIEFGKFVSGLRLGKIVSLDTYQAMVAPIPGLGGVHIGMYGESDCYHNEGGGGDGYGPNASWFSTPDNWTTVFILNTHCAADFQLGFFANQNGWRRCKNCQGLFFGAFSKGHCPAGGTHLDTGSGNYNLIHDSPWAPGQKDWRWCNRCEGLFFGGGQSKGSCPAPGGGPHNPQTPLKSQDYIVEQNIQDGGQGNWRWCSKCQGMHFMGNATSGPCPAGGNHIQLGSGDYHLYQV